MARVHFGFGDDRETAPPDPKIWLYPFLADLGITRIEANMSGSGDSGDLDDVTWYQGDTVVPNEKVEQVLAGLTIDDGLNRHHTFLDEIHEMFCLDGSAAGDWCNNEGGSALCRYDLDPETGVINLVETEYAPGEEYDDDEDEDDDWEPDFGEADEGEDPEDDDVEP